VKVAEGHKGHVSGLRSVPFHVGNHDWMKS